METVHKASPIGEEAIEDGHISISLSLPDSPGMSLEEAEEIYKNDADKILKVLKNHLPQGTRHQLLIKLLKSSLNLYAGR